MSLSINQQVLTVSVNLGRIGGWMAEDYPEKAPLIGKFFTQTDQILQDLAEQPLNQDFISTFIRFNQEYNDIKKTKVTTQNKQAVAEKILTWANILQHRSVLA